MAPLNLESVAATAVKGLKVDIRQYDGLDQRRPHGPDPGGLLRSISGRDYGFPAARVGDITVTGDTITGPRADGPDPRHAGIGHG